MSHYHRRKSLQSGVVAVANFVMGEPLSAEAQTETRRGSFDAHIKLSGSALELFRILDSRAAKRKLY